MIYMYAMRFIAVRKYKHYISVPSQAEKRALLYGSHVKSFIGIYEWIRRAFSVNGSL